MMSTCSVKFYKLRKGKRWTSVHDANFNEEQYQNYLFQGVLAIHRYLNVCNREHSKKWEKRLKSIVIEGLLLFAIPQDYLALCWPYTNCIYDYTWILICSWFGLSSIILKLAKHKMLKTMGYTLEKQKSKNRQDDASFFHIVISRRLKNYWSNMFFFFSCTPKWDSASIHAT